MSGKIQVRFAMLAALAALVAVLVPASLAAGEEGVTAGAGIIYLSMGISPSSYVITYGDVTPQPIPTKKNDCTKVDALNPGNANSILVVTEINALSLGEAKDQIGTKGPNDGSGEPCALAAAGAGTNGEDEGISVKLGEAAGDVLMDGFSVDIRLKSNGDVLATTYRDGAMVDSDPFTVEGPDNAPDSRDNFRWTYEAAAGDEFDEVRFMAVAGDFSLGGGANTTFYGDVGFDEQSKASQFRTVMAYDGDIECDPDFANIGVEDVDLTYGTVVMRAENLDGSWRIDECVKKPYLADVGTDSIFFTPFDPTGYSGTSARYTLEVAVENQPVTSDGNGQITSLVAEYDPAGSVDFPAGAGMPLKSCQFEPPLDSNASGYDSFWEQVSPVGQGSLNLLPSGDTACFISASVTVTGVIGGQTVGTEHWLLYFEDDPGVKFR